VTSNVNDSRRAGRLLRWYPTAWRERYGDEFVDHLEQEFADRTVDMRRTANIIYKGLAARVADVGFANADAIGEGRGHAAVATSFVLTSLMAIFMLNFWSRAMGLWGGRRYHPIPDTVATGALTVSAGLLLVVLVAIVLTLALYVVRQIVRGHARPLVVPSILATGSGAFLLYAARFFPSMLGAYIRGGGAHGGPGFPGIRLSHPGQLIQALATITWEMTQSWVTLLSRGIMQSVVDELVPLAVLVFGVAIALLVRRVEMPRIGERLCSAIVVLLGSLAGAYFIASVVWFTVGGPAGDEYFWPESRWLGVTYLVLLALVAVLVGRIGMLAHRYDRTARRTPPGDDEPIRISI
jgi:hypothetical protein